MKKTLRYKIYLLLDPTQGGGIWDKVLNSFFVFLIITNTLAVIMETMDHVYHQYRSAFHWFEVLSVMIFSMEYLLRVWTIVEEERFRQPVSGRLRYMLTPGAIVDLLAIAPFYMPLFMFFDLRFLRLFRLLRFLRFFKISRYLRASRMLASVFRAKKDELIMSLVITFFLIVVSASVMYFVEHDTQPKKFSSIPETMWWSIATLTTVGYGDVHPVTITGKILASVISILGIGMFALPAGILASGFSDEIKQKHAKLICKYCGREVSQ